jgi:hypothetical protein
MRQTPKNDFDGKYFSEKLLPWTILRRKPFYTEIKRSISPTILQKCIFKGRSLLTDYKTYDPNIHWQCGLLACLNFGPLLRISGVVEVVCMLQLGSENVYTHFKVHVLPYFIFKQQKSLYSFFILL